MPTETAHDQLLLLDTHTWIWLINGDAPLKSSQALQSIEHAATQSNLRLSAISVWEVGMLDSTGRITLFLDCYDWVHRALSAPGLGLVPIDPDIALSSSRLPGSLNGDPADRIIVATARKLDAVLVTKDRQLINYGNQGCVRVLAI